MSAAVTEVDILKVAAKWLREGHHVSLATVVRTSGSAPRQSGSHIVVRDDGLFAGSVSAGCVENVIIEEAARAMKEGKNRSLTFGTSDSGPLETGLVCGGQIEILIEPFI